MTAAGLIQRYPEIVEPLRDGRLNLSTVTQLAKVITPGNRAEVLPRFFHTSKREAKEVVAEILPADTPPLRTVVATIPDVPAPAAASQVLPEELISSKVALPEVAAPTNARRAERTEVEPLTAELRRLHVTVSRRLLDKLAAARDALSHSHPGATEETILEVGLDLIIERHRKRRGIGCKPRKPARAPEARVAQQPPPAARSRHVPADVWRAVWERDGGRCVWPIEGGGVCGSTHKLQLDHVDGWALGGETTVARCRLLCEGHNDRHARELYGDDLMDRYTRPKGGRCSEPLAPWAAARYGANAAFSSRSFSSRVPMDTRMQPSRPW